MSVWEPLARLISQYGDINRPVVRCLVTDISQWSASGAAYVGISIDATTIQAVYRDQPAPTVGQYVSAVRMSADPHALWLVLPAASVCPPARFVFSAFDATRTAGVGGDETDQYQCAVVALLPDGSWEVKAPHPCWGPGKFNYWFGGQPSGANGDLSYAARLPMVRIGAYLYTWAIFSDQPFAPYNVPGDPANTAGYPWAQDPYVAGRYFDHTHSDNYNLFRCADDGCTWEAVTAIREVRWVERGGDGLPTYAVADDGTAVYRSTDDGLTWAKVWDSPGATTDYYSAARAHRLACDPADGDTVVLTARDGLYFTADAFATVSGPVGPDFEYEDAVRSGDIAAGIGHLLDSFPIGGDGLLRTTGGRTLAYRLEANNRTNTNGSWAPSDPYPVRTTSDGGATWVYPWDGHILAADDPFPGSGSLTAGLFVAETDSVSGAFPDGRAAGVNGTDYWRVGTDLYLSVARDWPALLKSTDGGATWTTLLDKADPLFSPGGLAFPQAATGGGGVLASGGDLYVAVGESWFGMFHPSGTRAPIAGALYQRLYRQDGTTGVWSDATGTLYADTNATPDGATGRTYAFHDHGMAAGSAV